MESEMDYLAPGATCIPEAAYQGFEFLPEVAIPASVKVICEDAFADCTALRRVLLPEGLESIKSRAFAGCTELRDINIPSSVREIAADAFAGCDRLAPDALQPPGKEEGGFPAQTHSRHQNLI